jgi:hemin uptake protein HemP
MRHILNKTMTAPEPSEKSSAETAPRPLGRVSSRDLLRGRREVIIQHGQEQYRLRLTSSNKLILIK